MSESGSVRGEFSFGCAQPDCNTGWNGDDLGSIAQSVARHWNKEHGSDLRHSYEAIDEVQVGGHHIHGNAYEVRKYTVYITSFDVMDRIGWEDGFAVPNDSERVCDECLRYIEDADHRVEKDPDDPFNDEWKCSACLEEQEIERRAQENQDLGEYVTDGGLEQAEPERVRGTAGEHTHGMFLGKRWNDRAEENVEEWGNQRHDTVLLALIEEIGEIAMAMESGNAPGGGPHPAIGPDSPESRGRDLIHEMASLGRETRQFLESEYPSPAGDGVGDSEFEVHGNPNSPEDSERIFEEIDDAAPLLFQLYWAIESCSVESERSGNQGDRDD